MAEKYSDLYSANTTKTKAIMLSRCAHKMRELVLFVRYKGKSDMFL